MAAVRWRNVLLATPVLTFEPLAGKHQEVASYLQRARKLSLSLLLVDR
jgi:hypothetical protein